ncbi:MAG: gamma-glutamyltransferase [Pirellulaceae bacterium]|nr:gamma-glutamyltransferase [Pirellulaceae bacterium]MDP6556380.1 gamma-glutamyltransferase [Pirellulaceae bacterium]
MKQPRLCWSILASFSLITFLSLHVPCFAATSWNDQGMVATVHPLATKAGVNALRSGGNAVDAAVAAALTLGVVDGHNSGIGGGCFILIRSADGTFAAIDGRETAPARAHRDMYLRDGKPQPQLSKMGALASGTPGAIAAYDLALRRHGRLELARLLLPAAEIAENGFPIDRPYAADLKATAKLLARFPGTAAVLLKSDGTTYVEGEVLKLTDLAKTYRRIAAHGTKWFYHGPIAAAVDRWMAANGGILSREDFAAYRARERTPLTTTYRDVTVIGFPPPSSGGIHVAQMLQMLEQFNLRQMYEADRAQFVHVVAEAMKLAFADRAHWLGDADFAPVPKGLIDRKYTADLAQRINVARVTGIAAHGMPPAATSDVFGRKHTTHIAAADADGNWVAITATVNTTFGSKVIVPGTGIVMNNEMDDFSIQPGVPNAFGLIGAEANAVAPGKRPLSSMSPTIVLRDGQPILTLGAAGGPTIINQVLLGIIRRLDLQQDLEHALAAPRFHHQWRPDTLKVESDFSKTVLDSLKRRGHKLKVVKRIGVTQAIDQSSAGRFHGVHDPRVPGNAAGP